MIETLHKTWIFTGWFYVSLLFALVGVWKFPQLKTFFVKSSVWVAIAVAMWTTMTYMMEGMATDPWFRSPKTVVAATTLGQDAFADYLHQTLPLDQVGCLYASWDIPTQFLYQRLYPLDFRIVSDLPSARQCALIISQFKPLEGLANYQVTAIGNNYLYTLERHP